MNDEVSGVPAGSGNSAASRDIAHFLHQRVVLRLGTVAPLDLCRPGQRRRFIHPLLKCRQPGRHHYALWSYVNSEWKR